MAVIQSANANNFITSVVVDTVAPTCNVLRRTNRPIETISSISITGRSGALTGVAAAGGVFSFRYFGTDLAIVKRVRLGYVITTAFTTAQYLDYNLFFARNFLSSDSGGTGLVPVGQDGRRKASLPFIDSIDCRISSTAALTAGTRTLDTVALAHMMRPSTNNSVGVFNTTSNLWQTDEADYPLVLDNNEGIVITNGTLMGAVGVIKLEVNIDVVEVRKTDFDRVFSYG